MKIKRIPGSLKDHFDGGAKIWTQPRNLVIIESANSLANSVLGFSDQQQSGACLIPDDIDCIRSAVDAIYCSSVQKFLLKNLHALSLNSRLLRVLIRAGLLPFHSFHIIPFC